VITFAIIGLLLIVAAWVYQLDAARSGDKALKPAFALLYAAGVLLPSDVRSLDAIHLATALSCGDYPEAFITYDDRLAAAARTLHLNVLQPGRPDAG
jgi:predicted nucleic acid-binding protein